MSATSRSSSARPLGRWRCVDRCWPSTRHARRSEIPRLSRTSTMHMRRRAGLRSFPWRPPPGETCPGSRQRLLCEGAHTPSGDASALSADRSPCRRGAHLLWRAVAGRTPMYGNPATTNSSTTSFGRSRAIRFSESTAKTSSYAAVLKTRPDLSRERAKFFLLGSRIHSRTTRRAHSLNRSSC